MTDYREKEMNIINEEELNAVTGGDNGDTKWETEHDTPLYHVGDTVYVYDTPFHIGSTEAKVVEANGLWSLDYQLKKREWRYIVQYKNGKKKEVTADRIKNKNK